MRAGLWTGFFLLEERSASLETMLREIDRLKAAGFDCGEMDERNAYALFVNCDQAVADENARMIAEKQFFTQMHAPKPVDDPVAQLHCEERIIRACRIMNIRTMVTHPFIADSYETEPREKSAAYLARYAKSAAQAGLRLALENQIYPVSMEFYLEKAPELGVNIDFAHAMAVGQDVRAMIETYAGKLFGLHVSDSDGRAEDYHIMPGKGMLDWKAILEALRRAAYDGDLHLEIVHERSTEAEENDRTAKTAFETVSALMQEEAR